MRVLTLAADAIYISHKIMDSHKTVCKHSVSRACENFDSVALTRLPREHELNQH